MRRTRRTIPFRLYRGGTSKGVFMPAGRLPVDRQKLVPILLEIFGSPDARQINGLGGGDKLTSKAAIMGPPTVPGADIDYLFGQVGIRHPEVDFNLNCGNLTAAAAVYAIDEGFVQPEGDKATVRIHNVNTGRIITATVPMADGEVLEDGALEIGGVPGSGAPIDLDFAQATGAITGKLLPLGEAAGVIDVAGHGRFEATVLDGPNLIVLVAADQLGMTGIETPDQIDNDRALTARLQAIRATVAELAGLGEYWRSRAAPSTPMLVALRTPCDYPAYTTGATVKAESVDLVCRQYSTSATSKALAATVTAAIGMACRIPGTVAAKLLAHGRSADGASTVAAGRGGPLSNALTFGHPCGTITVRAAAHQEGNTVIIDQAVIQRTCHLIAAGETLVGAA
jgi:2-methylaconitate cis-trans-isomerase PrpF